MITAVAAAPLSGQNPDQPQFREVKWVRDSEEYAIITRMLYRMATRAVEAAAQALPRGRDWAVVLDADETALDNSAYELERRAYRQPHDETVYRAWIARRESGVVPGAQEFVATVRRLGGRIAWITNRLESARDDTRATLDRHGLWGADDRLCLMTADTSYTKRARRAEVANGTGACAWGRPHAVLVFVGDQRTDFPAAGEPDPDAGNDAAFGVRYFLLPNPLYGSWERRVTRIR
jgi:5'-nucleotidase (lipoprotein e(P4) family)